MMVYGSWSGGIFLLEIDKTTGLVIHPEADKANNVDPYYGKRLLGGGHISIEAHISCMMRQAVIIICLCRMEL